MTNHDYFNHLYVYYDWYDAAVPHMRSAFRPGSGVAFTQSLGKLEMNLYEKNMYSYVQHELKFLAI